MVGDDDVIAEFKGSFSTGHDFVDHFRGGESKYDRQWEERWIRDVGFGQFIPEAINGLCEKYGVARERLREGRLPVLLRRRAQDDQQEARH